MGRNAVSYARIPRELLAEEGAAPPENAGIDDVSGCRV